jgi:23S rRNA pseudouridine1911/1915/1917 synthase
MNENNPIEFSVIISHPQRLDHYLSQLWSISRDTAKALIKNQSVNVNNAPQKPSFKLASQDHIIMTLTPLKKTVPLMAHRCAEGIQVNNITIPILYEDDHILIINKPVGVLTHRAIGNPSINVVDALKSAKIPLYNTGNERMGIVHRLDQYTEGLMVVAVSATAYAQLKNQFKDRTVKKLYYAVLKGVPTVPEGTIDRPMGRDLAIRARKSCHNMVIGTEKSAITHYKVIRQLTNVSVVQIRLITGRTHQIRVHFSSIDCPVLGDHLYSRQSPKTEGYYLQSYALEFKHPITNAPMTFHVPMSDRLKKYAKKDH